MTNRMKELANLLGVELEEEFGLISEHSTFSNKFRISGSKGLEYFHTEDLVWYSSSYLTNILLGEYKIQRAPFIPKMGEMYFSYFGRGGYVGACRWTGTSQDYVLLKVGAVFRTGEEARKERPNIYRHLTGREWKY